jgi:hypothetical protein
MRTRTLLAAALSLAAVSASAPAQSPAPPRRMDAASRRAMVDSAASLLARYYVFADTGRMLAAHLRTRLAAGAFDGAATEPELGDVLTREMQAFNHDGHLYTAYRPEPGTPAAMAMETWRRGGGMPGARRGPMRRPEPSPEELAAMRRRNYNLAAAQVLDGNVGYIELTGLTSTDESVQALDAAMAFLAHVDAMIVDMRRAPGGDQMTNYLSSWFLPDSTPLVWNANRFTGDTLRNLSRAVGGAKRLDIPVYVLTSGRTASAAEAFALSLQANGRAKVVGDRSAGAGYNNFFFPLSDDMGMSISIGRAWHPKTGEGWEGTGVRVDIAVPAGQALAAARLDALNTLAARATDPRRRQELAWAAELAQAELHPVAVPAATLAAYAGTYGNRVVTVDGDRLVYQRRADRPGDPLTAISETVFAPLPDVRIEFVRDASGAVTALRTRNPGAEPVVFARTK